MAEIAIRAANLSKQYKIGTPRRGHQTLRDAVGERLASPLRRLAWLFGRNGSQHRSPGGRTASRRSESALESSTIWALSDVSLEINEGEVVGLIGRNGAGKSTLLKILSRITEPTRGRAEIHGRVGSLLEVGTGFHSELTGRENIYLNGSILGMKKAEIDRKFDEMVDFAGVERFIDTPVKRYSSGMQVRLAFAVAAHLEPDILLVDEVLAVGDAPFQEKCLGTMERSASSGKTVLFVSHNMPSIQHLCTRCILLEAGRIAADGPAQDVIKSYLSGCSGGQPHQRTSVSMREWHDRVTNGQGRIVRFDVTDVHGQVASSIPIGGSVRFSIAAEFYEPLVDPCFGVLVHDAAGKSILDLRSIHSGLRVGRVKGDLVVRATVENLGLYPGEYLLSPWITDSNFRDNIDWVKFCCTLKVYPAPGLYGDLRLDAEWGKYWVPSNWTTDRLSR